MVTVLRQTDFVWRRLGHGLALHYEAADAESGG